MEDNSSSPSQNHNGVFFPSQVNNKHQASDNGSVSASAKEKAQYSMPGILHFIQHEWARFELERSQWELDRAEFQVTFSAVALFRRLFRLSPSPRNP